MRRHGDAKYLILDDAEGLDGSVYIEDGSGRKIWLTFSDFEVVAREFLGGLDMARQFLDMPQLRVVE